MLVTFSGDSHTHLISLLATYQQGNEYYLIFPWAGGDLRSYWRDINPQPIVNRDTTTWVAEQCYGIARGLSKIHQHETAYSRKSGDHPFVPKELISSRSRSVSLKLFGRHGDIKPQNILWFDRVHNELERPTLKITDLGLAEFKTSVANIYKSPSKVSMTAAYRPPEYDTENGKVGRSHDIWALGCLYLEMAAWLLGGWDLVQEFERLRVAETTGPRSPRATEGTFFKVKSISESGVWEVVIKPTVTKVS
jgi:serine/threonine protein kinase